MKETEENSKLSAHLQTDSAQQSCPACGAPARRGAAQFCATCGRELDLAYLPADALRSSYHAHAARRASSERDDGFALNRMRPKSRLRPTTKSRAVQLPTPHRNGAAMIALAFVTYSLVPYLGILFCPGAVLMGGVGLLRSFHLPQRGGRKASYACVAFGVLVLGLQILLWWLLYKVPEWSREL